MFITLVAGEVSGDQLGAALIRAIRTEKPDCQFGGIGGPLMQAEGMDCWWDCGELAIMGLAEVIRHIPRLMKLRRQLIKRILEIKPDVHVGIDAPDFNLGVEKRLKARAVPVIHYVSPTVWAWRPGRVKTIARSTERVLCLFPFEPDYYRQQPVAADYTGHPLADDIPLQTDSEAARAALAVTDGGPCIALLPGSRLAEVEKLSTTILDAAEILTRQDPEIRFLIPAATDRISSFFTAAVAQHPRLDCQVFSGRSKEIMAAADVVVCASGTATLEVMLVNRPMVVCYRLATSTFALLKWFRLFKSKYFALPNILAAEALIPELLQDEVSGERIAQEVTHWLQHADSRANLQQRFDQLHRNLRINAAASAAAAVLQHISSSSDGG